MRRTAIGLIVAFLVLGCRTGDEPGDVTPTTGAVRFGDPIMVPSNLVRKSVVDINGGCTGTMLRPDWALTARHCTRGNSSLTVTHWATNTTVTVQSNEFYHPPDLSLDIALLHLPSPIDIDPEDPTPSVVPFYAGTGAELVGQVVEQVGFGNRDMKSLQYCGSDQDCPPPNGRCDLTTARPGRSQCYDATRTAPPPSGNCASKNDCPKGYDCDNDDPSVPGICYEMTGFINVSGSCSKNSQCGPYNRLCAPTETGWRCAEPVGCVSDSECPPGYACINDGDDPDSFGIPRKMCYMPSIIPSSPTCDMTVSCSVNADCGSSQPLCIDGHCCPQGRGLRKANELLSGLFQFSNTIAPAWNRKGVITPNGPSERQCLPGDSGGPYFLGQTLAAVVSDGTMHAASFRDWATEVMSPMLSGRLATGVKKVPTFATQTNPVLLGDFNGDGRTDVLTTTPIVAQWRVSVSLSQADGTMGSPAAWMPASAFNKFVGVGDFNGDGLDDLFQFEATSGSVNVRLSTGSSFVGSQVQAQTGLDVAGVLRVADVNGDSYADVVNFRRDGSVNVAFACGAVDPGHPDDSPAHVPPPGCTGFTGGIGVPTLWYANFWQPTVDSNDSVQVGDFNGDGYADILRKKEASAGGAGEAFVVLTEALPCTTYTDCADHMCIAASGVRTEGVNHCRSGFGQKPSIAARSWVTFAKASIVGDFNGDHRDDLGYIDSTGALKVALSEKRGGKSCTSNSDCSSTAACTQGYCSYTFRPPVSWGSLGAPCASPAACLAGDQDRDGRDDVFKFFRNTSGADLNSVWLYRSIR